MKSVKVRRFGHRLALRQVEFDSTQRFDACPDRSGEIAGRRFLAYGRANDPTHFCFRYRNMMDRRPAFPPGIGDGCPESLRDVLECFLHCRLLRLSTSIHLADSFEFLGLHLD